VVGAVEADFDRFDSTELASSTLDFSQSDSSRFLACVLLIPNEYFLDVCERLHLPLVRKRANSYPRMMRRRSQIPPPQNAGANKRSGVPPNRALNVFAHSHVFSAS
jgi:hypothetical protein